MSRPANHHHHRTRPDLWPTIHRPPEVQVIKVVEVVWRRGEGCCDDDPVRNARAYYSLNGSLLAVSDVWEAM